MSDSQSGQANTAPIVPKPIPSKSAKAAEKEGRPSRPWRDNIEAITMAIIMAIFLKYFIIEAYKIPTGSMQPTLMGNPDTEIFDRILVDKLSYHYRDPERFEVAVFKYPLDLSKNFIKRICGMPGEDLKVQYGDLWRRDDASQPWEVLRRPGPVQEEVWKTLDAAGDWRVETGGSAWTVDEDGITATAAGSARFPKTGHSVMDVYLDGYPTGMAEKIRRKKPATNEVGDLRIEVDIEAAADCREVYVELLEHTRRYRLSLPGPKATDDARPEVIVSDASDKLRTSTTPAEASFRLEAGDAVRVAFENLDDRLRFELDGELLIEVEIPPAAQQRSTITLGTEGGGARFDEIEIKRDIYYTTGGAMNEWSIPDDCYVMLGDNTQDSADSREWRFVGYRFTEGEHAGESIRGNARGDENPRVVTGGPDGTQVFFVDQFGERHHFGDRDAVREAYENAPFVKRELITGRALLVFWPFSPSMGVYRLHWIH